MENVSAINPSIREVVKYHLGDEQCAIILTAQKDGIVKRRLITRKDLFITNAAVTDFSSITGIPCILFTLEDICSIQAKENSVTFMLKDGYAWTIARAENPRCYKCLHLNSTLSGFENAEYTKQNDLYILSLEHSFVDNQDKEKLFSRLPFMLLLDNVGCDYPLTLCYANDNGQCQIGLWNISTNRQATPMLRLFPITT